MAREFCEESVLVGKKSRGPVFRRVYEQGNRKANDLLVLYYFEGERPEKIGVSVSRRVGKAVVRNKVKRRIKEAFRFLMGKDLPGEIVVVARAKAADATYSEILSALRDLLKRMDLL